MRENIKELMLWKKKSFRLLLCAGLLLLLIPVGMLFFRTNRVYTYEPEIFEYNGEGNGVSAGIPLPKGIYAVVLHYVSDSEQPYFCNIRELETGSTAGNVFTSGGHLEKGLMSASFDLWIERETVVIAEISPGDGQLLLESISFHQTYWDIVSSGIKVFAFYLIIMCIYLVWQYNQVFPVSRPKRLIGYGLFLTIVLSSIPLMTNHIYGGPDVTYHLLRIANIKDGLLSGQFPVRIDPSWLCGHGYASSVCYGDIFLYIPALLRMAGFTLQQSYSFFLFLINTATCLIAYYSFRRIFKNDLTGLFCTILYTLSIYRLYKMYSWAALGEAQSLVFLPLILYGIYLIFTSGKSILPLVIGYSGIIQSHILTCEIVTVLFALLCVILWRKTFRKKTFIMLIKAVAAVCVLNAWFLVPFLDYMLNMDMIIHHVSARTIQENGLYPAQLFFAFFHRGGSRDFVKNGLIGAEAMGVGMALTFGLGIFLFLWSSKRMKQPNKDILTAGKLAVVFSVLTMIMSLSLFPWTSIQNLNIITEKLVSSLQHPNRLLMIATVLLCMVSGIAYVWLKESGKKWLGQGYYVAVISIAAVTGLFYVNSIALNADPLYLYDEKGMRTGYLSGAEYLPYGTNPELLTCLDGIGGEGVDIFSYTKESLRIELECTNSLKEESYVDLPLLNYKGYKAKAGGESLTIESSDNHCVRVLVPAGFGGEIKVNFSPLWYWRMAEVISLAAGLFVIGGFLFQKRRKE